MNQTFDQSNVVAGDTVMIGDGYSCIVFETSQDCFCFKKTNGELIPIEWERVIHNYGNIQKRRQLTQALSELEEI